MSAAARRPAAGQDLLPAVDALLRGQLGDDRLALPQGERGGGEARHPASRSRRGSSSSRSATSTTRETARYLLNKGLAFRAMHSHGRALNALLPHAVDDVEDYDVREGELISNVVNGWNFGDAHFHGSAAARGDPGALRFRAGRRAGDRRSSPSRRCAAGAPALRRSGTRSTGCSRRAPCGVRGHGHAPALAR